MRRSFRFEDVAEALPELATDVDEMRGVEDLRVHSSVRVEIVVGVVVWIHFVVAVVIIYSSRNESTHLSSIMSNHSLASVISVADIWIMSDKADSALIVENSFTMKIP